DRANGAFEFGPFRLDVVERTFDRNGSPISLPPKVFDTLVALVQSSGHMVSKDELLKKIWPGSSVAEDNLNKDMYALGKALGEEGPRWIEAFPKHGYRFMAEVRALSSAEAPFDLVGDGQAPHGTSTYAPPRPLAPILMLLAASVCIAFVVWN